MKKAAVWEDLSASGAVGIPAEPGKQSSPAECGRVIPCVRKALSEVMFR